VPALSLGHFLRAAVVVSDIWYGIDHDFAIEL